MSGSYLWFKGSESTSLMTIPIILHQWLISMTFLYCMTFLANFWVSEKLLESGPDLDKRRGQDSLDKYLVKYKSFNPQI